jgi:hypothetical protein
VAFAIGFRRCMADGSMNHHLFRFAQPRDPCRINGGHGAAIRVIVRSAAWRGTGNGTGPLLRAGRLPPLPYFRARRDGVTSTPYGRPRNVFRASSSPARARAISHAIWDVYSSLSSLGSGSRLMGPIVVSSCWASGLSTLRGSGGLPDASEATCQAGSRRCSGESQVQVGTDVRESL